MGARPLGALPSKGVLRAWAAAKKPLSGAAPVCAELTDPILRCFTEATAPGHESGSAGSGQGWIGRRRTRLSGGQRRLHCTAPEQPAGFPGFLQSELRDRSRRGADLSSRIAKCPRRDATGKLVLSLARASTSDQREREQELLHRSSERLEDFTSAFVVIGHWMKFPPFQSRVASVDWFYLISIRNPF